MSHRPWRMANGLALACRIEGTGRQLRKVAAAPSCLP